jgi:hypothetical protein
MFLSFLVPIVLSIDEDPLANLLLSLLLRCSDIGRYSLLTVFSRVPFLYFEHLAWFVDRHDKNPVTKDLGLASQTSGQEKIHLAVLCVRHRIRTTKTGSRCFGSRHIELGQFADIFFTLFSKH